MTENDVVVGSGRTVMVGVKFDALCNELLTWVLVNVAEPGDTLIALHILGNENVERSGKSSFFSLVRSFDSVLGLYEGFCNVKKVNLKLKLCRGSSTRKILVREAKLCSASKVVVGISRDHHRICSSASVAKYLAKKLSKDCWVLAINNNKIVFQKEGKEDAPRNPLFSFIQMSLTLCKNTKVVNDCEMALEDQEEGDEEHSNGQSIRKALVYACLGKFSSCGLNSLSGSSGCNGDEENNLHFDKSMAIVPAKHPEISSRSLTMVRNEPPEFKPGWPLLRRAVYSDILVSTPRSYLSKQISVVQWVLKLPSRSSSFVHSLDTQQIGFDSSKYHKLSSLNSEKEPILLDGNDSMIVHTSTRRFPEELDDLHERLSTLCRFFNYKELMSVTSNFSTDNFIGKGGSSRVFKGCLPNGTKVAVKILKQTKDILKDFVTEIEIITTLHHKNIISLLGFCFENSNLLLVYNYLSRGSLEENLHGNKKDPNAFHWNKRYKVAVGIAAALDYLHNTAAQPVIHRDVKSSNILLSDDFEPQLSDFGFAKWGSESKTHIICSDVMGTFGYLAPEYFMYGKVNDKTDVYAYGVVLLELLSGRKPISNGSPKAQESLVVWAKPILDDKDYGQLLDPSLVDNKNDEQVERMVLAATLCIRQSSQSRPTMDMVLKLLKGDKEMVKWTKQQVNKTLEDSDILKTEKLQRINLQSHLNLAFHDIEDDSLSVEQNISVEDYLKDRTSRSSSFN